MNPLTGNAPRLVHELLHAKNLVALWTMNEASGTVYDRCTKNLINGTPIGSPTMGVSLGEGFYGITVAAASSQCASLGTPSALAFTDAAPCAAVALLKVNNTAAIKTIIGRRSNAGNTPGWEFRLAADETIEYVLCDDAGGQDRVGSLGAISAGALSMVGFSKTGAGAAAVTLYAGGAVASDTDDANAAAGNPTYTNINASIGARNNADQFFDGTLGLIAIFSEAKSAQDFRTWAALAGLL